MGEEGVEESFAVPAGVAEADAEVGKRLWEKRLWEKRCVLLSAGSGGDDPLAGIQGLICRSWGSDSQQTALGLRNR